MKKIFFLTAICAALTACGGGSGGDNGGSPAPSPTPTPTAQCTLPTLSASTNYVGITPSGDWGVWNFTQSQDGKTLTVSNNVAPAGGSPSQNTFTATANSSNCAFITTQAGIQGISTAFNGNIAISAAQGVNRPAFLVANPITDGTTVNGTYYVVNYEKEGNTTTRSSYRKIIMDSNGHGIIYRFNSTSSSWEARHEVAINDLGGGSGLFLFYIVANDTYHDDSNEEVGLVMFTGSGASKAMVLQVGQINADPPVVGMWLGSTTPITFPTGYYVDNQYDESAYTDAWTGGVNVTSTTIQPVGESAITFQINQPLVGFIGLPVEANMPVDMLISSTLGFFATTPQTDPEVGPINTESQPSITFGVRPPQQ